MISTNLDLTVKVYAIKAGLVLIPAQKLKSKFKSFTFFFSRNNSMKLTEDHALTLCGEVLLQEPFKHPRRILDKEKAADMERNEQAGTLTKKHQSEKASA